MPLNTPVAQREVGGTTTELSSKYGKPKQIVVDVSKNTVVVMDGSTPGGHPLAKEAVRIKSGSPNVKINDGDESFLLGDIEISVLPGYVPTAFRFVENPPAQPSGKYLEIEYVDGAGQTQQYYVNAGLLSDTYTAGAGIVISPTNEISLDSTALTPSVFVEPNSGLEVINDKLHLDLGPGLEIRNGQLTLALDDQSLLQFINNRLSHKALVSADPDNILAEGSDKGVYMPGDLGSLSE